MLPRVFSKSFRSLFTREEKRRSLKRSFNFASPVISSTRSPHAAARVNEYLRVERRGGGVAALVIQAELGGHVLTALGKQWRHRRAWEARGNGWDCGVDQTDPRTSQPPPRGASDSVARQWWKMTGGCSHPPLWPVERLVTQKRISGRRRLWASWAVWIWDIVPNRDGFER